MLRLLTGAMLLLSCLACGEVEEPKPVVEVTELPEVVKTTDCFSLIHAWCDYHIGCGTVRDNISECMDLMGYLYCPADGSVESKRYAGVCYQDLTTAECGDHETGWPAACYGALGIEGDC